MNRLCERVRRLGPAAGLAAAFWLLMIQGCATPGLPPSQEALETSLRARAIRYWEARRIQDLVAQYGFEEPRIRERQPLASYVRGRGATIIEGYEIREVRAQGDEGAVTLHLSYRPTHPQLASRAPSEMDLDQVWVRVDGEWYLKHRPVTGPGSPQPQPSREGIGPAAPAP